ncbi:MAG TPA: alpha-E domain-containing protein [Thermosynechococcus sp. M46_R2017_013]|nr:alpha-E domain-containing protein [Thermosynechococcus sp. M46_R2017_013]
MCPFAGILWHFTYPNSIISCLRSVWNPATSIREVISSEMWQ